MSERQACELMEVAVSSYRYRARSCERADTLRAKLTELAQQYPRFGSPRLCALVRREDRYNHKLVERVYREAGLSLRRKKRRRLQRQRTPKIVAQSSNEEWAMDFVTDSLASARHLRILTVVDVFTRECLALETDTSIGSLRVLRTLDRVIGEKMTASVMGFNQAGVDLKSLFANGILPMFTGANDIMGDGVQKTDA